MSYEESIEFGYDRVYLRSEMPIHIHRYIKQQEDKLKKVCLTIWTFTNPLGDKYIFANFVINRTDKVVVTLGHFDRRINQFLTPR